jgi:hypothetical protein
VGSLRLDGVRFVAYPQDHAPVHVHGFRAETEAIVELRIAGAKQVSLANRKDAVRPGNSSRQDVKHILAVAAEHFDILQKLWEEAHA